MVDKELKFFDVSITSKKHELTFDPVKQMTLKCAFIPISVQLSRQKISKLLIASLAGENFHLEVIIVDRHCPNSKLGGGAFGEKLLSVKLNSRFGSIT